MLSAKIVILSVLAASFASGEFQHAFEPGNVPSRQEADPAKKLTAEQRGDVYMARKMFREAIDAYKEASPMPPVIWNKIGIAYHQLGDFGAARKHYERAIKLDRKYADAINNDGTVYYALKNYRGAIVRYRKAIQLQPESASFWSNLGTAYYMRNRFEDMAKAYQKALELDPTIFEHRGTVGTELQDRTVTDRARYHYELARMYAQAGKNELALQYLRKSLEEGLKDKVKMTQVKEFAQLRETDEFKQLISLEPRVL